MTWRCSGAAEGSAATPAGRRGQSGMRRSTGGEVAGSISRPPNTAAIRNRDSGTWVARQGRHSMP